MNRYAIVPGFTALGVVLGALVWFVFYSLQYTASIGYDGQAEAMLGFSMVLGGAGFGIIGINYAVRKKHIALLNAVFALIVSGFLACVATGFLVANYAQHRYSYVPSGLCPVPEGLPPEAAVCRE